MKVSSIDRIKGIVGKRTVDLIYRSLRFLPDKMFIRILYFARLGKFPNLRTPKSFTEKLQYLKIYDHKAIYTKMADKLAMRSYVEDRIGLGHTVPVLDTWERFDDIDFSSLPNQFVLKTNHDSGTYFICKDSALFDIENARKRISERMKYNYYYNTREWQYKNIVPMIFCEELLDDDKACLTDYKFFCFNGVPKFMYIEEESSDHLSQAIMDMDFRPMPFSMEDEKSKTIPPKPKNFDQMIEFSRKLSEGIPFLRVDMYSVKDTIYIGELTFYHNSGFSPFNPPQWDEIVGQWLDVGLIKKSR